MEQKLLRELFHVAPKSMYVDDVTGISIIHGAVNWLSGICAC